MSDGDIMAAGSPATASRSRVELIEDEPVLDDFGPAVAEMAFGKGAEDERVDDDRPRLGERADEVLPARVVDAGLAADGGVHHAEEGRGNVDEVDAAQAGRGGEAGQVGDDAAAEADDEVGAFDALADEPVVDAADGASVFCSSPDGMRAVGATYPAPTTGRPEPACRRAARRRRRSRRRRGHGGPRRGRRRPGGRSTPSSTITG